MGTLTGIGPGETAPHFDPAQNDYVDLLAAGNLAQRFDGTHGTISMWIKADAGVWTDGASRYVFQIRGSIADIIRVQKSGFGDSIVASRLVANASSYSHIWSPVDYGTGWWHLAMSWSETFDFVRVYVNGVLLDEGEQISSWTP